MTLQGTKTGLQAGAAIGLILGIIAVFGAPTDCSNDYRTWAAPIASCVTAENIGTLIGGVGFGAIFGGIIGGIIHMIRKRKVRSIKSPSINPVWPTVQDG